jgi:8-oxo-dGTP pyrophosphatase MutT (NUDIX family)/phosphohistidine phosphatase SixA
MADAATGAPGPPMAEAATGVIHAAGAVLWRARAGGIETALVHRPRYDDWSFPKGKSLPGEHMLLTAVREVEEETGVRAALGRRLPSQSYPVEGQPKRVEYWAARPLSAEQFTPGDEVDDLAWLPLPAARELLSYPRDVSLLDSFTAGPADSAPVILLRHAAAVSKKAWRKAGHAGDLARPLSDVGQQQARALGQLLSTFAPARVISSAAQRCLDTVTPYAEHAGVPVTPESAFTVDSTAHDRGEDDWTVTNDARLRIAEVAGSRRPVIICAHRQNLSWMLAETCERAGAPVPDGHPLQRGAFWVLQLGGGRLVSAEQHQVEADPVG